VVVHASQSGESRVSAKSTLAIADPSAGIRPVDVASAGSRYAAAMPIRPRA
jgi:hypothetical protein